MPFFHLVLGVIPPLSLTDPQPGGEPTSQAVNSAERDPGYYVLWTVVGPG